MCQKIWSLQQWNEEVLLKNLAELTDEYGLPSYSEDMLDYIVYGAPLREWVKALEKAGNGEIDLMGPLSECVAVHINLSIVEPGPWFFMYGVYKELICNRRTVMKKILETMEIIEENKKMELEGCFLNEEEISYIQDLEEKYIVDIGLLDSKDDVEKYYQDEVGWDEDEDAYNLCDIVMLRSTLNKMRTDLDFAAKCEQEMLHPLFPSREERKKAYMKKDLLSGEMYEEVSIAKYIDEDGSVTARMSRENWEERFNHYLFEFTLEEGEYVDLYLIEKRHGLEPACHFRKCRSNYLGYGYEVQDVELSYKKWDGKTGKMVPGEKIPAGIWPIGCREEEGKRIWMIILDDRSVVQWAAVRLNGKGRYLKTRFHITGRGVQR